MGKAMNLLPRNITACMSAADQRAILGRTPAESREKAIVKDERELQKQIANYLRLLGVWNIQSRMDKRASNTLGTPDFVFPYKGNFVAWEVKIPWAKSLRPEQTHARDGIIKQGGEWRLITAFSEAQEHLRELDYLDKLDEQEALERRER